ncbi:hypothetical protein CAUPRSCDRAFT_12626, partial [Caulochytrium protostelioides]
MALTKRSSVYSASGGEGGSSYRHSGHFPPELSSGLPMEMPVPDDADYPESFRSNNRRRSHGRYQPAANDEPDSKETRAGHVDSRPSSSDKTLLAESGRPGDGKEGWEADYQEKFVEDLPDAEDADAEAYIRGVVPETDDPDMPVFTFRVLVLGTFWGVFLSSANAVLAFRTNNYNMGYFLASLL